MVLSHKLHEAFKGTVERIAGPRTVSAFKEEGVLRVSEFVGPRDNLVSKEADEPNKKRSYWPADKQYHITGNDHYQTTSVTKCAAYIHIEPTNNSCRMKGLQFGFQRNLCGSYSSRNIHCGGISGPTTESRLNLVVSNAEPETNKLAGPDQMTDDINANIRNAIMIQEILKSYENDCQLETTLNQCKLSVNEELIVQVLQRHRSDWKPALSFFNWASAQKGYCHGSRAYNNMLDILGRMKQIKMMRQVFDEIPEEKRESVINNKTFAILMNRYAGAHKVQEAIDIFYKRKDYGFELDLVGFQTLLMSLCRFKHVEEAEALFLQKQDEFPQDIKSRNIILNGWCVLGSLHEAKRFWNDIISSKCKPDLFTYSIFINSLTKAGKLGTAVKLFTSMWEKGCNPDVTICNTLIDQLCFKKKIPEALEIFSEMNERGCIPDVATYNSLIKHLCKIKRMKKVYELLDEMDQKNCPPNARTFCYILKTAKTPEEVSDLLRRMERTGCKLDSDICNLILNLYMGLKYQKGIQSVWSEMEKNGLGPDQRSYTIMVHGLYGQGKLDESLDYYNKMRSKGMVPEPRTRLLVKAIHLKREKIS